MINCSETFSVFVERLQDLMMEKNLNIKELSAKTNIPRSTINGWTLKISRPQIEALCILADFFGVTTDYLLGRED